VLPTLLILGSLLAGQAEAAAPAAAANSPDKLAAQVKTLIRQLDSNQQARREAAEKELIALGPDVLPLLPAMSNRTPAEIRNRLLRVRTALMQLAIEATTKPALVTLEGEMLLSEALAKIEEQTGNHFVDYRERFNQQPTDPTVKVSIDKRPFWQAVDTVLDAAGMTIYNYDDQAKGLAYTARGPGAVDRSGRGAYSGLFRIEPVRVDASRDLRTMDNRSLKVTADLAWEPRIRPIVLEQPLSEIVAVDEKGNPIEVDGREGSLEVPVETANAAVEMEFPLVAPDRSVRKIASLKGKLTAVVLGRVESFEIADIDRAKSVEQERGGVTVTLDQCRKNGDIYDVQMRVRFDKASNALESHRGWIYTNDAYLLDPKGNRVENAGLEATLLDVNEVGLAYKFDLLDASVKNCKFVYATPAAILKIPVEFELKDIDLP
jgi:hypothetical protein